MYNYVSVTAWYQYFKLSQAKRWQDFNLQLKSFKNIIYNHSHVHSFTYAHIHTYRHHQQRHKSQRSKCIWKLIGQGKSRWFNSFYTSTKSWRGYIFTSVCVCVCLSVCMSVCPAFLVNIIPPKRMYWFGRSFR